MVVDGKSKTAFFAYPSGMGEVAFTIREAIKKLNRTHGFDIEIEPWEENDIAGRFLRLPIIEKIDRAVCLYADISVLNFNVTYEIGYAIGRGKRVVLLKHGALKHDSATIQRIGIFDTLGYESYYNADDLSDKLRVISDYSPLPIGDALDRKQPVYVLGTPHKTESMVQILSRIKKEQLFYRSFDPSEQTRLAGPDAVQEVASSYGVVVPLLQSNFDQADIHNIRAAFVAGLAHGMSKTTLILQPREVSPVPLDIRDLVTPYESPRDLREAIASFQRKIFRSVQIDEPPIQLQSVGLAALSLGSSIAENEFQHLGEYYLKTDEYQRVLRAEADIVAGRKGAGKTALFAQARNALRVDRLNIVVDLKPEGFQLLRLKDQVLQYLGQGAKSHVLVTFWQYILLMEIARKCLEKDEQVHLRDQRLYEPYTKLRSVFADEYDSNEGDFSDRLTHLAESIGLRYAETFGTEKRETISTGEVTQLVHAAELRGLIESLVAYLAFKKSVRVLIDNLDKGWSSQGVSEHDILIIRCLIDAAKKLEREFQRKDRDLRTIIFIRDDVYRFLLSSTSDHGKEDRILLDWRDPEQLRRIVKLRLVQDAKESSIGFDALWAQIADPLSDGSSSFDYILAHALMRPRYLLNCINHCKAYAVNLGHSRIQFGDVEKGLKAYSDDLIVDTNLELVDVFPRGENILYEFAGSASEMTRGEYEKCVSGELATVEEREQMLRVLLWQGVLGVRSEGKDRFIYDVGYNMARLEVLLSRADENEKALVIHRAYWRGLDIVDIKKQMNNS